MNKEESAEGLARQYVEWMPQDFREIERETEMLCGFGDDPETEETLS